MRFYSRGKMPTKTYPEIDWKRVNLHRVAGKIGAYNKARNDAMRKFGLDESQVPPRMDMATVKANIHDSKALRTFERQLTAIRKKSNFRVNPDTGRLAYLDQLAYRVMETREAMGDGARRTPVWDAAMEREGFVRPRDSVYRILHEAEYDDWEMPIEEAVPLMSPEEVKAAWDDEMAGWYSYGDVLISQIELYWGGTFYGREIVSIIRKLQRTDPAGLVAVLKTRQDETLVEYYYPLDYSAAMRSAGYNTKVAPGLVPDLDRLSSGYRFWTETYRDLTGDFWFNDPDAEEYDSYDGDETEWRQEHERVWKPQEGIYG